MNEDQNKQMGQLIAKCWTDEDFKAKLLADPAGTIKAEGGEVPEGVSIKVVENTDTTIHLVIPVQPSDLSDEELDGVAGGMSILALCY